MFLVGMLTDASPAIKKHHTSPLFHEFHTKFYPSESVFVFQSVPLTLATDTLTPQAWVRSSSSKEQRLQIPSSPG